MWTRFTDNNINDATVLNYRVKAYNNGGASPYSTVATLLTVGVEMQNHFSIRVYPNPVSIVLHIESESAEITKDAFRFGTANTSGTACSFRLLLPTASKNQSVILRGAGCARPTKDLHARWLG